MPDALSEAQITTIFRDTIDALYGYASRKCGGQRQLAEDVTQEAWLRAVREWRRTGVPEKPLAWLTTVVRNLLLNEFRRHVPVGIDEMPDAAMLRTVDDASVAESEELAALVSRALERMPSEEARLLEAFHYERRRMSQLAETYGVSERAIEGRLRRARERLRRELERTLPQRAEGGLA
ncbi:MAG TPA: sigma-70 family RNA polymerase sigma factor [Gemmatimonadaceae bacterium]|jgi:RNA polymerase sigma-70 factor (ECF subfamily)|nr:sigma-70 family RNA polymerase sigma factor [Gemmatimonadaceae bacterium]